MAKNFIGTHRTKIIRGKRIALSTSALQKGMIVEARYKPMDKMENLDQVNPSYKGFADAKMVHALTLNNFSPPILNKLAEKIGLTYIPKYQKMVALDIPKLIMNESSQRFYSSELKKEIENKYGASYRTMLVKSFNSIELVNYNWDKAVLLKFFPKEDIEE